MANKKNVNKTTLPLPSTEFRQITGELFVITHLGRESELTELQLLTESNVGDFRGPRGVGWRLAGDRRFPWEEKHPLPLSRNTSVDPTSLKPESEGNTRIGGTLRTPSLGTELTAPQLTEADRLWKVPQLLVAGDSRAAFVDPLSVPWNSLSLWPSWLALLTCCTGRPSREMLLRNSKAACRLRESLLLLRCSFCGLLLQLPNVQCALQAAAAILKWMVPGYTQSILPGSRQLLTPTKDSLVHSMAECEVPGAYTNFIGLSAFIRTGFKYFYRRTEQQSHLITLARRSLKPGCVTRERELFYYDRWLAVNQQLLKWSALSLSLYIQPNNPSSPLPIEAVPSLLSFISLPSRLLPTLNAYLNKLMHPATSRARLITSPFLAAPGSLLAPTQPSYCRTPVAPRPCRSGSSWRTLDSSCDGCIGEGCGPSSGDHRPATLSIMAAGREGLPPPSVTPRGYALMTDPNGVGRNNTCLSGPVEEGRQDGQTKGEGGGE